MSAKTPDTDWISTRLEDLTAHSDALVDLAPGTSPSYGPLTALKLFLLAAQIEVYTRIIPDEFDHSYYIDVLAGAGVTQIKDHDVAIAGSPLIATTMSDTPLDRYYFIEKRSDRADALAARLDYIDENTTLSIPRDRCVIRNGNANEEIPIVINEMKQRGETYGLGGVNRCAFIDNEGLDVEWGTIEALLQIWGDTLITFPSVTISRKRGKEKFGDITQFFGTSEWIPCETETEYRDLYSDRLAATSPVELKQRAITVNSRQKAKRFYYDLLYSTRATANDSPYIAAIDAVKKRFSRMDGNDIEAILALIQGTDQMNLHFFDETALDKEPTAADPGPNTTLDQFAE
jgi:three-Cys-motif partner protein